MTKKTPLKTAAIGFLNARPLTHAFENGRVTNRFDLSFCTPAECTSRLSEGAVQLATIPAIGYSDIRRSTFLRVVPGICISAQRTVQSVELFFKSGIANIKKVAVDTSSRTSVALLRIILREKYGIDPQLVRAEPDLQAMLQAAEAALIIGDEALGCYHRYDNRLDLVEEWLDLTDGLPFVFAFWGGLPDALEAEDVAALTEARDRGEEMVEEIVAVHQSRIDLGMNAEETTAVLRDYLATRIAYEMGEAELKGLREFYRYCFYYGVIEEVPDILFYDF